MIGVLSGGIAAIPHLEALLCEPWTRIAWWRRGAPRIDKVVGWGARGPARRAQRWAAARGLPYVTLEDGFLRSVGLGHEDPPLSIVADDLGVYFDSRSPSRLEQLIAAPKGPLEQARAQGLIRAWRAGRVSKYNHARDADDTLGDTPPTVEPSYILVVDQARGDPSIAAGLAGERDFDAMLEAALDEHPRGPIVVKSHPEVLARRRRGHFERLTRAQAARVTLLATDVHPTSLIERARGIYVVTSQIGLEGLLWGKPVRTFGLPFYAGWGLTQDERPRPARRRSVEFANLVHASLVEYLRCVDPETGEPCTVERLIAHLGLQRTLRARCPAALHAVNFSPWKKPIVRSFFAGSRVRFVRAARAAPADATLLTWGVKHSAALGSQSVIRLEDGFLRSVGLGADLITPLSWTMDRSGIHYDPTRPSDLEQLLATTEFDPALLRRAAALREELLRHRVTKYNLDDSRAGGGWIDWKRPEHPRVILVPGQGEDDASLRFGHADMRTNVDLLRAVRRASPEAYVIYKRHPDVVAGLRPGGSAETSAESWCDEIVADVPLDQLFAGVDEVQVMSSLTGFEALIRGLRVITHGCPFYSGWGLTVDRVAVRRRARVLSVNELIAGALILYPLYVSRRSGRYTTVERVVSELIELRAARATSSAPLRLKLQSLRRSLLRRAAVFG
jgi:capsular polysaccharide export protein